jgi:uncharacterized membrane protein
MKSEADPAPETLCGFKVGRWILPKIYVTAVTFHHLRNTLQLNHLFGRLLLLGPLGGLVPYLRYSGTDSNTERFIHLPPVQ